MATAGDKKRPNIIKELQKHEDEELEDLDDIREMLEKMKIDPDLAEDLLETMYDQLAQYTKGGLFADIQMAGPTGSIESFRKAHAYGHKKTAENVHRARNSVTTPEIAETVGDMEDKHRKWKKDIAHLKDADAYDFGEAGMVSILLDVISDEAHKEITAKYKTTGKKAASLKENHA